MTKLSAPVATLGVLIFGTAASLLAKLIYSVHATNIRGETVPFTKPWFQVFGMFAGMAVCIVLDLPRPGRPAGGAGEATPLLAEGGADGEKEEKAQSVWIINWPTLLDLFATACGTTGLLYTTVSVYQMLRGAQLVFTALLSILFLGRRLTALNFAGIALCVLGIICVGFANVWGADAHSGKDAAAETVFGVLIILAGQVLQASQVVLEEHLLQNLQMSSVRVVAYEGMFGALHCLLWVFPLLYLLPGTDHGHLENPVDAFYMFFHSPAVLAVVGADMALMLAYNVCGMEVTNHLSAVSRVIIETLRTLFVWLCDLVIFYVLSGGRLGEPWTTWSYLQALGFALTVAGTVVYNYEHLSAEYHRSQKPAPTIVDAAATPLTGAGGRGDAEEKPRRQTPERKRAAVDVESGVRPSKSHPLSVTGAAGEDEYSSDEEEEDDEVRVGSFIGSASHGSYIASSPFAKSPFAGSLRQRHV